MPARGLQFEIIANLAVVVLAGLAIVAVVMAGLAAQTVERAALDQLRGEALHLERIRVVGGLRLSDLAALVATLPSRSAGVRWAVLDARGREVRGTGRTASLPPSLEPWIGAALASGETGHSRGGFGSDLYLIAPLEGHRGERGLLVGIVARAALWQKLGPLLISGAWVLATGATVFVGFGAYLLRRRIVRPVLALRRATRRVAEGDLELRTPASGSDELAELARGFDQMTRSLLEERRALTRAHDSLWRSRRLATVGQLAAGVAHEVGNPLAAILGYGEVVLRDDTLSERTRNGAERIRAEALRVRALVRELLDLARSEQAEIARHDPVELLERVAERLRPQKLLEDVELRVDASADLAHVLTDAARVEQILVNLVENAAHALAGHPDGVIELTARSAHTQLQVGRRRHDPPEADFRARRRLDAVALSVIDNGPGIDPEHQPHVFDPFFTTKDPGVGTGLGLWNAHRLAELLEGRLELESAPGRTAFSLLLPIADTEPDPGGAHAAAAHSDHR